jgi:hypothetical protein
MHVTGSASDAAPGQPATVVPGCVMQWVNAATQHNENRDNINQAGVAYAYQAAVQSF